MIVYPIGTSGQSLIFADDVLGHFHWFRQIRPWHAEAGGQLFARFTGHDVQVTEASGPRRTDRRSRTSYWPDIRAEQREITARFREGLHFIGDWHTHPQNRPTPSGIDLRTTANSVRRSRHALHAFVVVIVGRAAFPTGLHVSLHDGSSYYVLDAALDTAVSTENSLVTVPTEPK